MIFIGRYPESEVQNYIDYIIKKVDKDLQNRIIELLNNELQGSELELISNFEDLIKMDFSQLSLMNNHLKKVSWYYKTNDAIDFFKNKKGKLSRAKKYRYLKIIYTRMIERLENELKSNPLTDYKKMYSCFAEERENSQKNNVILAKALDISVCPYCNRNFINTRGDRYSGRQYDHFFSRDKVPYFALSLYNLVPSCSVCNHTKSNSELMESCPFDETLLENDNRLKFKIDPTSDSIRIDNSVVDVQTLKLNEAYEMHSQDVKRLFNKEREYCQEYRQQLLRIVGQEHKFLFSEESFDKMIFGDIINLDHSKFKNEPLSYLKHDTYQTIKKFRGK